MFDELKLYCEHNELDVYQISPDYKNIVINDSYGDYYMTLRCTKSGVWKVNFDSCVNLYESDLKLAIKILSLVKSGYSVIDSEVN